MAELLTPLQAVLAVAAPDRLKELGQYAKYLDPDLTVPQARVLQALMPDDPSEPQFEWPLLTRAYLCLLAGFKLTSGSITRVLNGIRPGNTTSGAPHPGLVERRLVEKLILDIVGVDKVNYRITAAGIRAFEAYLTAGGELPEVKDAATCTNCRYQRKEVADAGR